MERASWRDLNLPRKPRSPWDNRGGHTPVAKGSNVLVRKAEPADTWQPLGKVAARVVSLTAAKRAELRDRLRAERARAFPGTTPEAIAAWWKQRGF